MNNKKSAILFFIIYLLGVCTVVHAQILYTEYTNSELESSEVYLSSNIYQKDFILFVDMLKTTHPIFAFDNQNIVDLNAIEKEGYLWTGNCTNIEDLKIYLQTIMARLNDGHSFVLPDFDRNALYPFQVFVDIGNDSVYLFSVDKPYQKCLGKKILEINHFPVMDVVQSFKTTMSSDNDIFSTGQVDDYMMFFSLWVNNPYSKKDSSIILTFEDNTEIILLPDKWENFDLISYKIQNQYNEITQWKNELFFYTVLKEKNICYLQFNQCYDQGTVRFLKYMNAEKIDDEMEKQISMLPRFDTLIANMFQEMRTNEIKTLIVDVRNNSGGNSLLCDVLLSYLKPTSEMKESNTFIRISPFFKKVYPNNYQKLEKFLNKYGETLEMGKLYLINKLEKMKTELSKSEKKIMKYFQSNEDRRKVFDGSVYFFQSQDTYSSTGDLIINAVDNGIGTVIGEKSSYKPCSYGDVLGWKLPNTGIQGGISHKLFNRPDESKCHENFLTPHILLEQNWVNMQTNENKINEDKYWEWIIKYTVK